MNRLLGAFALVVLLAVAVTTPREAAAYSFPERWNTGTGVDYVYAQTMRFLDLNGDGRDEIACLMSGPASGRVALRVFDNAGQLLWTGPELVPVGASLIEVRLLDVDQNGTLDYLLQGPMLEDMTTNFFVFGWNGSWQTLDQVALPTTGVIGAAWFHAELEMNPGLELVTTYQLQAGPHVSPPVLKLHMLGAPGFAATWNPGDIGSTSGLVAEAHDLNANGVDELYVMYAGRIWMYSSDAAVAAVAPGVQPIPLTMSSPFPNPTTGDATIRYRLSHGAAPVLRVHDAAGRAVREIALPLQPAGEHEYRWDGRLTSGGKAAPGVYWLELDADGVTQTRRVVRLR